MKHRYLASFLALAGVLGTTSAFAAPGEPGLDLGLRLGYGIPMGDAAKGAKMSDGVKSQIPIWIDAGYRFTPNIMAGLYLSYGFASLSDKACPSGADCSASVLRYGIQGQYRLSPGESINPWFGIGIGMESASYSVESFDGSYSGMEFLDLQGGVDFKVADGLGVGPFLSFSLAQYGSGTGPDGKDHDIEDTAMHQWLILGARGVFEL